MKRHLFAWPVVGLLFLWALPLILGSETLFLRDVFNTHLEMKQAQAEALSEGRLPWLDPYRAGGQPLLANPNAVALYPDNLLLRWTPLLWAHNAHFWLHLLLAPWAMASLGRAVGLSRRGAWVAAACYGFSGWTFSLLNFYNLVAYAALAPALASAALRTVRGSRGALVATALLWALTVVAGDPVTSLLTAALALTAAATALPRSPWQPALRLLAACTCGTLLALPQITELLRILPLSYRGYFGYQELLRSVASLDPRQVFEWFLPFAFGRPDVVGGGTFWGHAFYTDTPAFFFTLYPGALAWALLWAAGRPRRARPTWRAELWAWGVVAGGVFFALGRFNPIADGLLSLGPSNALRYPIKLWLAVALGASVLTGFGFERAFGEAGRWRRVVWPLGLFGLLAGALLLWLNLAPGAALGFLRELIPADFPEVFVANERDRWSGLSLLSLAVAGALLAAAWLTRRRPSAALLLLALHGTSQLFFLAPAVPTDDPAPYRTPPAILAAVPPDALSVHGAYDNLFGPASLIDGDYPDSRSLWWERRAFDELYPFTGALWGRRFALNVSPEGLDSIYTRLAQGAVEQAGSDRERLLLLTAWGVDRLLLHRPLEGPHDDLARLIYHRPSYGREIFVYALDRAAPSVVLATTVERAPHMNAALWALRREGFDAAEQAVVAGDGGSDRRAGSGAVTVISEQATELVAQVTSPAGGMLVWQRAYLPLFEATIDGAPVPTEVANLHRLAVEVPAGEHVVRLALDKAPFFRALGGSALGALGLVLLWLRARRRPLPAELKPKPGGD
ncbi:MAG: hypothetical protein AAF604_07070 [Acidobacteriota bacterium]